jgi:hypothetical protein
MSHCDTQVLLFHSKPAAWLADDRFTTVWVERFRTIAVPDSVTALQTRSVAGLLQPLGRVLPHKLVQPIARLVCPDRLSEYQ